MKPTYPTIADQFFEVDGYYHPKIGNAISDFNRQAKMASERIKADRGLSELYNEDINTKETEKEDMVNHPSHYTRGKVETIDGIESAVEGLHGKEAGLTWQVIKYMWRWKFKGNPLQDLQKAEFYLKRLIRHVEEQPNE